MNTYICFHCGQPHEYGARNPCEDQGRGRNGAGNREGFQMHSTIGRENSEHAAGNMEETAMKIEMDCCGFRSLEDMVKYALPGNKRLADVKKAVFFPSEHHVSTLCGRIEFTDGTTTTCAY